MLDGKSFHIKHGQHSYRYSIALNLDRMEAALYFTLYFSCPS